MKIIILTLLILTCKTQITDPDWVSWGLTSKSHIQTFKDRVENWSRE